MQLLAGIPSVVYGFFGMVIIVPGVRARAGVYGGHSLLSASLLLGIMILPTIITVPKRLDAVPDGYYEGAWPWVDHERAIFKVVVPAAAKSGVMAAIVLGVGRAIGETMAVVMVAGNQTWMPRAGSRGCAP